MRVSQEIERTFNSYLKYGHVIGLFIAYLILTPIVSLILSSMVLFILLTLLLFLQLAVGWRLWRKGMDRQEHQRVMGFMMIGSFGLHSGIPFFYYSFGTIYFLISAAIFLVLLGLLFAKTKAIAQGIHNPKSFIGKAFIFATAAIMLFAIPAYDRPTEGVIMQLLDGRTKELYIITSMYLLGLILTFILPVFFYPVQKVAEEHPKGRRKPSRAERKTLKAHKAEGK